MAALAEVARSPHYALGVMLVLLSAVALSTLGVGVRHIEAANGWQILFYRSVSFTAMLLLIIAVRYRGRVAAPFRLTGRTGLVAAFFLSTSSAMYVFAMLNTTVANASFVVSTTPFLAALFGLVFLREPVRLVTWIAMAMAMGGVALMVADGLTAGGILGIAFALGVAVGTAAMLVSVRGAHRIDMIPALAISGVMTACFSALMVDDFAVSRHDLMVIFLLGAGQYAIGFALLTAGLRYLPVAEAALLGLLETILGPVWAWLGAGEIPSLLTISGGIIVVGAAAFRAIIGLREERLRR